MGYSDDPDESTVETNKRRLRRRIVTHRNAMSPNIRTEATAQILVTVTEHLRNVSAVTVAAYSPMASEPGGGQLPNTLRRSGFRVLLPIVRADFDLDWAIFDGSGQRGSFGTIEPTGQRLGVDAITNADAVVVPALAAGANGERLGRGGGSYDRALARVKPAVPIIALLFDGEWPQPVPTDSHDVPVTAVVTPEDGFHPLTPSP